MKKKKTSVFLGSSWVVFGVASEGWKSIPDVRLAIDPRVGRGA